MSQHRHPLLGTVIVLLGLCLYYACANPVGTLTGGDKDTTPPRIVEGKSTPNPSLNFDQREITFTFDEWVKLQDVTNQVVVTPPLKNKPSVSLRGKSVRIRIDERDTLRPNTTYIINMGNAVRDLTEGNSPPNLKFVFSTGSGLDSLTAEGEVFDLLTGKGVKGVTVMLYDGMGDSLARTEKPYYFAKTDESGRFKMEYLREGTYRAVALVDANANYLFDLPNEKIGFLDETVTISDTVQTDWIFKVFEEDPPLLLLDSKTRESGVAKFIFNRPAKGVGADFAGAFVNDSSAVAVVGDTVMVWYNATDSKKERYAVFSSPAEGFWDTVSFTLPVWKDTPRFKMLGGTELKRLSPADSFYLDFNLPVGAIDTSRIRIMEDSLAFSSNFQVYAADTRRVVFGFPRKAGKTYQLQLLPDAIRDMYGQGLDTLSVVASAMPTENYGSMKIKVLFPDKNMPYLLHFNNSKHEMLDRRSCQGLDSVLLEYSTLPPGRYNLRVIRDENGNGRRDSGNFDEKRQPERIFEKQLEELRANWELEATVEVVF